ncbi:Kazal-like serine protease inhibitor domain-containing protein [Phytophthora sojae]|uniref:Kazal-like serine protease inhibitor domain-containing protein n=1 Tax=Phytophthora sojae (strain P6497) TaxID=1094619 RepID=G4Z1R4_PHYSP|nr:Kazal-like serine protease inhibitor domain-containing protein [Phytophthora sojae]EGZ26432.1 Kazal-like serine protease inhibitor domain-containing protein [Phytophthora sojae]|eukprot:XP_009521720.1 Kazal-like serine protease inhibitor domain-containing protein [Phytophthora sojae]
MKLAVGVVLAAIAFCSVCAGKPSTSIRSESASESTAASDSGESWDFSWDASDSADGSGAGCDQICPTDFDPVCGSDGVTYTNDCAFGIAQCRTPELNMTATGECAGGSFASSVKGSNAGSAAAACPDACVDVYDPVSDESGKTYSNECYMRMAKCKNTGDNSDKAGIGSLFEDGSHGVIGSASSASSANCSGSCPDIYSPVCGSDGVTYSSPCKLELASCKNPKLKLVEADEDVCAGSEASTSKQETVSEKASKSTKTTV